MNQPTGVLGLPRRNPPRATALPRHNHNHTHTHPVPTPSQANRVTRSSATRQPHHPARQHDTSTHHGHSSLDSHHDDSDASDDATFTQHLPSALQQTIASTRERRHRHRDPHVSSARLRARARTRTSTHPSTTKTIRRSTRAKPPAIGTLKKRSTKTSPISRQPSWPSSAVIPPWQHLEWTILVQIFEYASFPLDQKSNVRWLLSAALSCKAFLDPALKALYKSAMPQLISLSMSNKYANLIRKLAEQPDLALARQDHRRTMVEFLVVQVSTLPHSQNQSFDVAELILSLPRLSHIELFHELDLPPYRMLDSNKRKWTYPRELVNALRTAGDAEGALRLKSWTWSERLMTPGLVQKMHEIHAWATFSQLRKLALVNFQVPSLQQIKHVDISDPEVLAKDNDYIGLIAASLTSVENLRHLVLNSSTVVDGQFLSLLPKTIEHLEIHNCWEVTADMLADYLVTHGSRLRQLTLHHNQSLSLSFLPLLGESCPELRELSIDLLTYSHHEFYNDSRPIYDTLLTVHDVPSWPKKLEVIELEQLAKWDAETAEMFFQSFVDQAPSLPRLRHLAVKAMLDVPWRQRSEFRDKWVRKLKRVFFRKSKKPRPYHSLIQWPLSDDGQPGAAEVQPLRVDGNEEKSPPRRSTRKSTAPAVFVPAARPVEGRGTENARKRKRFLGATRHDLRRSHKRGNVSYRDPDTDEDLDLEESSSEDEFQQEQEEEEEQRSRLASPVTSRASVAGETETETFIHGLCESVNIRFDNQKPREFQWGAEDFLDEDLSESNDGEWTSDREVDEDSEGMAW